MVSNGNRISTRALPGVLLAALLAVPAMSASAEGTAEISRGQQYYEKICAKCHETGIGPVLLGRGLPEVIFTTIPRSGLRAMPAFRVSDIDDATLQSLAKYLANSKPKP
ncbi:c-type cytochrome [Vogesella indigofera]|uniref:c-type cytochrome n=1 Tax=Vogesella indigofera TaxID=45465 RepID=UPI00234E8BE5|nr:cytochrome c [Vogesella indigofera]MDC7710898.1 cytochrome c [Vogesella indigofera]